MPAVVENCVTKITPALRKRYPDKTDSEITQMAWGICTKMHKEGKLADNGSKAFTNDGDELEW